MSTPTASPRPPRLIGDGHRADPLDVTDRAAVLAYAEEVAAAFGHVNQVYNNAGVAFAGDVLGSSFDDIERVVDIDFWGVVNGTKAFLPHLIASGDGHVVNISSLFGLLAVPGQSAYNAAKFAVRGFTESLRQEMLLAGHAVRVTCVHPGGIKTNIARNATRSADVRRRRRRWSASSARPCAWPPPTPPASSSPGSRATARACSSAPTPKRLTCWCA